MTDANPATLFAFDPAAFVDGLIAAACGTETDGALAHPHIERRIRDYLTGSALLIAGSAPQPEPLDLHAIPASDFGKMEWEAGWRRGSRYYERENQAVGDRPIVRVTLDFNCSPETARQWATALADLAERVYAARERRKK